MKGKCLIFSAPSGSGKSTIVNYLLTHPELKMVFSISATSRKPRGKEQDGVEYYFLSTQEFKQRIANNEFLEYEEVYEGCFYGTLKKQVYDKLEAGYNVVFDVDVEGGCNIKQFFGEVGLELVEIHPFSEVKEELYSINTHNIFDENIDKSLEYGIVAIFKVKENI